MNQLIPAAVTGVGPVSAIGNGAPAFWDALVAGRSGLRRMTRCIPSDDGCTVAAEVDEPRAMPFDWRNPTPRAVQLALEAARMAAEDADLEGIDPERIGVVVGTSVGNIDLMLATAERLHKDSHVPSVAAFRIFAHSAACEISRNLDLQGRIETLTSGCNAGADAIGMAIDWLRLGYCDAVVAGGIEAELTQGFIRLMEVAEALDTGRRAEPSAASRPFDSGRDGNVPGEGAGFLVLEHPDHARDRGARVRAYVAGFANRAAGTRPKYRARRPHAGLSTTLRTFRAALDDAGISTTDVSAMSANGSSSVDYDRIEAAAIVELFSAGTANPSWPGPGGPPTYSVKAVLGQTGAVSPALQAIAAVLSAEHGIIPPTPNTENQDPECPVNLVRGDPLRGAVDFTLAHSIGFGGFYNTAVVVASRGAIEDRST